MNELLQSFACGMLLGLICTLASCFIIIDITNYFERRNKISKAKTEEKIKLLKLKGDNHGEEE